MSGLSNAEVQQTFHDEFVVDMERLVRRREGRTKILLRELVAVGQLEDDGATKGKKYRKP